MDRQALTDFSGTTLGAAAGVSAGGWLVVVTDYWTFRAWFFRIGDSGFFAEGLGMSLVVVLMMLLPASGAAAGAYLAGSGGCGYTAGAGATAWFAWVLGIAVWLLIAPSVLLDKPGFSVLVGGPVGAFGLAGLLWLISYIWWRRK